MKTSKHSLYTFIKSLKIRLHKVRILLPVFLFFGHLSCEQFVEMDLPTSQLTSGKVFEEASTAHAAMLAVYAGMRDQGVMQGLSYYMGLYADELDYYGTETTRTRFFTNSVLPSEPFINTWWNNAYFLIYSTNSVIEKTRLSTTLEKKDIDQLTGEALFTRALIHFYLVNLFGDIPYITTTDYLKNKNVKRQPINVVYNFIINDLTEASKLLNNSYISTNRTRPNKAAVLALLARVYLYTEQWTYAVDAASEVINLTDLYPWETNLNKVFLKGSSTTIWQWASKLTNGNTFEGQSFIFTSAPPTNVALSEQIIQNFEESDLRRVHWIKEVSNGIQTWYHAYKYKEQSNTNPSREYTILFRLGELYLIRAEAYAHLEAIVESQHDLNKIRGRAGLSDTTADSKETLLEAIFMERSRELFTETGHRFFDLKRTGKLDEFLVPVKPGWNSTKGLFPLPEKELLLNPELNPQNPGYN